MTEYEYLCRNDVVGMVNHLEGLGRDVLTYIGGSINTNQLYEIFGNPFRPTKLDPRWLTANVRGLAATLDNHQRVLDPVAFLALGDALEEAGCVDVQILQHCRGLGACKECSGLGTIRVKWPDAHGDTDTICCPTCNHDPDGRGFGTPETKGWQPLTVPHQHSCWVLQLLRAHL